MHSLRRRAILGGAIWALVSVAIGGAALLYVFETVAVKRFDDTLLSRHLQVVIALSNSDADPELMDSYVTDPAYDRPYSGRYWQATSDDGTTLTSRSLFDTLLPYSGPPGDQAEFWSGEGPEGQLRGVRQQVAFEDGSNWNVSVAEDLDTLVSERRQIRQTLLAAFAMVGLLGIAGAVLQTSAVLGPLATLRADVAHRWDAGEALEPASYPEEVAPLVSDINTLLARNREIVDRGRRQAADLAHALKTPSAVLRNELLALRDAGTDVGDATDALDRVDAQILRSLARIRAGNTASAAQAQTDLNRSISRLVRLFRTMPGAEGKDIRFEQSAAVNVRMDIQDLEEVLGNLLENAVKWSDGVILVSTAARPDLVSVVIEDDGPGIPEAHRREALRSGGRLDSSAPGTGLGLAIAADLVQAYGGDLQLSHSERLGGLRATVLIPARHAL